MQLKKLVSLMFEQNNGSGNTYILHKIFMFISYAYFSGKQSK